MTTAQTEFRAEELLADHDLAAPLIVDGVRCHGGFADDGTYVSPRTKHRVPAIEAWETQRLARSGTPLLDVPLETWPATFPTVTQSAFLIRHGVPEPTIGALTRIGTIEGFGSILRALPVPDLAGCFMEDVRGTATAHIAGGLFEAHARDEAGYGEAAGHDRMWFAARDIAFEHPVSPDETERMLQRMGIPTGAPSGDGSSRLATAPARVLPDAIPTALETVVRRMVGLLLIEISAFHGFIWAEALLGDRKLVAGDGEAGAVVSYIRQDETPHVAWLRTALSEMRDFTWLGTDGSRHPGERMIATVWEQALHESVVVRRGEQLAMVMREIEVAVAGRRNGADLVAEMLALGSVGRGPDGRWCDLADPIG